MRYFTGKIKPTGVSHAYDVSSMGAGEYRAPTLTRGVKLSFGGKGKLN
jgi:hypothetical protein